MKLLKTIAQTSSTFALLPIRIALALVMIGHGAQKLFGLFGGNGLRKTAHFFESGLGLEPGIVFALLAGGCELIGGFLVLIGFMTRPAALSLAFTMGVAILKVHSSSFFLPEGMEYALTLLLASLALLVGGAGRFSFDRRLSK